MIFKVDHGISVQATKAADSQFLSLLTPRWPLTPMTEYGSSKPPHRSFLDFPLYLSTSTPPPAFIYRFHTHIHTQGQCQQHLSIAEQYFK